MRAPLQRFAGDERGAAAILYALCGAMLFGFGALATDVGYVYLKSRELQGAADLAALAAARDLGRAQALAEETVRANRGARGAAVAAELGLYTPDIAVRPRARFRAGAGGANAVRVELASRARLFFGRIFIRSGSVEIRRTGVAAQSNLAAFEIGSRLLALRGGVANTLLGALTGSNVSLSVMDYRALLAADVDLFAYVDALRTRIDLDGATFSETLAARMETADAVNAIADVLATRGDPAAAAIRDIARAARGLGETEGLDRLVDLGPYAHQDAVLGTGRTQVSVNALNLATAILDIAGGERQVRFDLGADIPGLADVDVWLAIGERPNQSPWIAITDSRDVVIRTAQMRLYLEARVSTGLPAIAQVTLPVFVEAASAQARLSSVRCAADGRGPQVTLSVAPSLGKIAIAGLDTRRLDDFRRPMALRRAEIVRTGLARVDGFAETDLGGARWQEVPFSDAEIAARTIKTVQTRDIAATTVASTLGNLDLNVRVLGAGLGTSALTAALTPVLTTAAAPLDDLINGLADLLGVRLGEADVRVNGVRCDGATLVG
ncbi:MAG: hypothetical protein GC206_00175 [Alphaproteobacteria bacterium]|nr:hypothetical protein [Alphaproteobacteria bacterium]